MTAREACRQLVDRFHACVDDRRASASAELFAADAVVETPLGSALGASEIANALAAREGSPRTTVHVVGSFDFRLASDEDATAAGSLVIYGGANGEVDRTPEALAHYAVAFRRAAEGWQLGRLEVRVLGHHDGTQA